MITRVQSPQNKTLTRGLFRRFGVKTSLTIDCDVTGHTAARSRYIRNPGHGYGVLRGLCGVLEHHLPRRS